MARTIQRRNGTEIKSENKFGNKKTNNEIRIMNKETWDIIVPVAIVGIIFLLKGLWWRWVLKALRPRK